MEAIQAPYPENYTLYRPHLYPLLFPDQGRHIWKTRTIHGHAPFLSVLAFPAEFTAGLAAAGALLADGTMTSREIILALLVGNILSSPIRAFRHQFPYYAGIFKPGLALQLILYSQSFRLLSIVAVTVIYLVFL